MASKPNRLAWPSIAALIIAVASKEAFAHVKWFADFDYASVPKTVSELSTGTFWSMFGLAVVVLLTSWCSISGCRSFGRCKIYPTGLIDWKAPACS